MNNTETLREKMKSEVGGIICSCGNPININRINEFWLAKIAERDAQLVEAVEGLKVNNGNWEVNYELSPREIGFNKGLDAALDVLRGGNDTTQ